MRLSNFPKSQKHRWAAAIESGAGGQTSLGAVRPKPPNPPSVFRDKFLKPNATVPEWMPEQWVLQNEPETSLTGLLRGSNT